MKIEVLHEFSAPPADVLEWVSDLERYPQWTHVLHRVVSDESASGSPRAWIVELRGKIGPFARSKRLRMERVATQSADHVRFERRELDGVDHGRWNLDVHVVPGPEPHTARLSVSFEYEGRLWSGAVERLLRDEIESSKQRLTALVVGNGHPSDHAP